MIITNLAELKITYMTNYKAVLTKISFYGFNDYKKELEGLREILTALDIDFRALEDGYYKTNDKPAGYE